MSETEFYRGQPVFCALELTLFDPDGDNPEDCSPVLGLPNVWYQWDGEPEPPCDGEQKVLVQAINGDIDIYHYAKNVTWEIVEWYMIINAVEVIK